MNLDDLKNLIDNNINNLFNELKESVINKIAEIDLLKLEPTDDFVTPIEENINNSAKDIELTALMFTYRFAEFANRPKITTNTTGTVKWFNSEKGYGFITPDNDTSDVFVHFSAFEGGGRPLEPGQKVTFNTEKTGKGVEAFEVQAVRRGVTGGVTVGVTVEVPIKDPVRGS